MYETESELCNIGQLDGNVTNNSYMSDYGMNPSNMQCPPPPVDNQDKITAALCLPTVATYNCISLLPKIGSLKTDIL